MNLTDFLLERIADDEAVAESLRRGEYDPWGWQPHGWRVEQTVSPGRRVALTPARMLAECEAKRRIVERSAAMTGVTVDDDWPLNFLALPYADHPDFDESWRA